MTDEVNVPLDAFEIDLLVRKHLNWIAGQCNYHAEGTEFVSMHTLETIDKWVSRCRYFVAKREIIDPPKEPKPKKKRKGSHA